MSEISKDTNFEKDGDFYITGVFDNTISRNIIPELKNKIESEVKKKDGKIVFYINSDGGEAHILKSLLFLITKAKKEGIIIETNVLGDAFSAASLLACVGTKGHRFISEFGEHLCHYGESYSCVRSPLEIERNSNKSKRDFKMVVDIYKQNSLPLLSDKIEKYMETDLFYVSAKDCLKYGLADKII